MSVKVITWVWDHSQSTGNDRLTLLAIADSADHDGSNAWPTVSMIAAKTRLSERTVQRCISRLIELGELAVEDQAGGRVKQSPQYRPNLYTVVMDTADQASPQLSDEPSRGDRLTPLEPARGDNSDTPRGDTCDTQYVLIPSIEPKQVARAAPAGPARLPENFRPDDVSVAAMRRKRPDVDLPAETRRFVAYWQAKPGKAGEKTDWQLTWRNWISRARASRPQAVQDESPFVYQPPDY